MPADIPADVAYIGGVWTEGVLYGKLPNSPAGTNN